MSLTQVTTGGVDENINIDSNTLKIDGTNNRVGIGISTPGSKVHVFDGNPEVQLQSSGTSTTCQYSMLGRDGSNVAHKVNIQTAASALTFGTGGSSGNSYVPSERMRIDSSGRVGIGNTAMGSYNGASNNLVVGNHTGAHGLTIASQNNNSGYIMFADGTSGQQQYEGQVEYNHASNHMRFLTSGNERLRIDNAGNCGIGTTTPGVASEGAGLQVRKYIDRNEYYSPDGYYAGSFGYTSNAQDKVWLAVDSNYNQSSAVSAGLFLSAYHQDANSSGCGSTIKNLKSGNALTFSTVVTASSTGSPAVETERMRIDSSGNVGINESSPSTLLSLGTSLNTYKIKLYDNGDANDYGFGTQSGTLDYHSGGNHVFYKSGSEKMRLDSAGRFRVPGYGINVAADGSLSFSDYGYSGGGGTDGVLARHNGNAYFSVDDHFRIRDNANNNENKKFDFDTNAGHAGADGNWNSNNFDFAEMLEWSDGNPNAEDRIGYSVAVDGLTGKIKIAEEGDVPIGIVSGTASFVANAGEIQWVGRSKRDEWGRFVYEPAVTVDDEGNEVPLLDDEGNQRTKVAVNPDWDESRYESYIPRSKRPEWACIGVIGQVYMRKNCPVDARWIKLKEIDSVKDLWLVR